MRFFVVKPLLSTVCVVKSRSLATPFESVSAMPVTAPVLSLRTMVVSVTSSATFETLAWRVMSSCRWRLNSPVPVTSTAVVSTLPSMKSMLEEPVITTSLVFDITTSVSVKSPLPSVSIPMALFEMVMSLNSTSLLVRLAYLNAAPADPVMVPETSPPMSLW